MGAQRSILISSGFSPICEYKCLCNAWKQALTTTDLPTPAPPSKKAEAHHLL
jgi:hypothetical protein